MSFGGYATRLPAHHPEIYLEAFAQIYRDAADLIQAHDDGDPADATVRALPGIDDGIEGLRFISGAIASSLRERWIARDGWSS